MRIIAATDGSALSNPAGPAGWAWYASPDCWQAGGLAQASNNAAELTAVIELLHATATAPSHQLEIVADSRYVIDSLTRWHTGWARRGWRTSKGEPVANPDLIKEALAAMQGRPVAFTWVRGHAGHPLNVAADAAATSASAAIGRGTPVRTGPGWRPTPTVHTAAAGRLYPTTRPPQR